MLTVERLREVLTYSKRTGVFTWRVRLAHRIQVGAVAGTPKGNAAGHLVIRIDGVLYLAHRLAWLHVTGTWPQGVVDHRFGDGTNNRWRNLRDVTQRVNCENQRAAPKHSRSGILGAGLLPDGKFRAQIKSRGVTYYLGKFASAEKAQAAYLKAKRVLHEGCTI